MKGQMYRYSARMDAGGSRQSETVRRLLLAAVAVLSVAVLGEPATAAQLAGGAMILGFTLLNELRGQR